MVRPRSHCPVCGTRIADRDNVPVLSWLLLRGRCRTCDEPISVRYPMVELATGALFVTAALRFGADWVLPAYLLFFAALLAVSLIDLELHIVPNRIVYPTLFGAVPLLGIAALIDGDWRSLGTALLGAVVAGAGLLVIHLVSPRGMGFGDVRLAVLLGLFLGWINVAHVALGLFLGFFVGAVGGVVLIALRMKKRRDHVPFAPFLSLGALIAVLAGNPILDWYIR